MQWLVSTDWIHWVNHGMVSKRIIQSHFRGMNDFPSHVESLQCHNYTVNDTYGQNLSISVAFQFKNSCLTRFFFTSSGIMRMMQHEHVKLWMHVHNECMSLKIFLFSGIEFEVFEKCWKLPKLSFFFKFRALKSTWRILKIKTNHMKRVSFDFHMLTRDKREN